MIIEDERRVQNSIIIANQKLKFVKYQYPMSIRGSYGVCSKSLSNKEQIEKCVLNCKRTLSSTYGSYTETIIS